MRSVHIVVVKQDPPLVRLSGYHPEFPEALPLGTRCALPGLLCHDLVADSHPLVDEDSVGFWV